MLGPEAELLMERKGTLLLSDRLSLEQLPPATWSDFNGRLIMMYGILKTAFEREMRKIFRRNTGH